jgi:hypothetical protein
VSFTQVEEPLGTLILRAAHNGRGAGTVYIIGPDGQPLAVDRINLGSAEERDKFIATNVPSDLKEQATPAFLRLAVKADAARIPQEDEDHDKPAAQGQAVAFPDENDVPWPESVEGATLLGDLAAYYSRYVVLPAGAATVLALWTVFAHALKAFDVAPILALLSREKRSGKSTTLTLLMYTTPRPLPSSNMTAAAVFRSVEKFAPTLCCDEAETFINMSEETRGVINSGHTRALAYVVRTVGDEHEPRMFSTWCAKIVALIGRLPGTLEDRSIAVHLERRKKTESITRLRLDRLEVETAGLRRQAARWAEDHLDALRSLDPEMPEFDSDRARQNWIPLFAIATLVGGKWPELVQEASAGDRCQGDPAPSLGQRLLMDIQQVAFRNGELQIASEELCRRLIAIEDSPWGALQQRNAPDAPIDKRKLAGLLKRYGVRPHVIRVGDATPRGYSVKDFADAFERYSGSEAQHAQHQSTSSTCVQTASATHPNDVADNQSPNLFSDNRVEGVAVPKVVDGVIHALDGSQTFTPERIAEMRATRHTGMPALSTVRTAANPSAPTLHSTESTGASGPVAGSAT